MIKFKQSIQLFSLLLLTYLLSSCSDHTDFVLSGENDVKNTVKVENGIMVFDTRKDYEHVMSEIASMDNSQLQEWEENLTSNFTSMRKAFENLTDEDIQSIDENGITDSYSGFLSVIENRLGGKEAVMNVDSHALATVLNNDGLVRIGDKAYLINYYEVLEVSDNNLETLTKGIDLNTLKNSKEVTIYNVTRQTTDLNGENLARIGECYDQYTSSSPRYRFKGELWVSNTPPVYSGAGARAKHQRRRLNIWWANETSQISLKVDGTFSQSGPGGGYFSEVVDIDLTANSTANIQWAWYECFNVSCTFDADARVEVAGIGRTGNTQGCVIQ